MRFVDQPEGLLLAEATDALEDLHHLRIGVQLALLRLGMPVPFERERTVVAQEVVGDLVGQNHVTPGARGEEIG